MTATATEQQIERGTETLREMLELLGFTVTIEGAEERGRTVTVSLKTDEPGRIIGRKGSCLDRMEHLLNSILRKEDSDSPRFSVDVDGYERQNPRAGGRGERGERGEYGERGADRGGRGRPRRDDDESKLERKALDAAKEVKRWGETKTLGPLNARERRVIHMALKELDYVSAESGEEVSPGMKRIVVRPADV